MPIGRRVGALGPVGTKSNLATSSLPSQGPKKWADWLHNRCLLRGPTGVGVGNSPKVCPVHALRANAPSKWATYFASD